MDTYAHLGDDDQDMSNPYDDAINARVRAEKAAGVCICADLGATGPGQIHTRCPVHAAILAGGWTYLHDGQRRIGRSARFLRHMEEGHRVARLDQPDRPHVVGVGRSIQSWTQRDAERGDDWKPEPLYIGAEARQRDERHMADQRARWAQEAAANIEAHGEAGL